MRRPTASSVDPLAIICAPPHDESSEARQIRELAETEARKVNESIDEQLRQERAGLRKKKKPIKVLLLGQSESGKSATLKNFQLQYAHNEWARDRAAWRAVIFLNLVRNIIHVLDVLLREMSLLDDDSADYNSDSDYSEPSSHTPVYRFTDKHRLLKVRLGPLRRVQADLEKRLGPASQEVYSSVPVESIGQEGKTPSRFREFGIISRNGWKTALEKFRPPQRDTSYPEPVLRKRQEENYEVANILAGCREDMMDLWNDAVVQEILTHRKAHIEDSSGFFLDDIERIASSDYEPSDHDIVRARLRTVGLQEHRFNVGEDGTEWVMYDIGGTRSCRAVWASYFDDADAIIFLSPISCFDETLREDSSVNRLEDSYQLWRSVCASPLLARTQIILFLNKCDILRKKLLRGTRVKDFIRSFGERKNDRVTVLKYFQSHFRDILRLASPEPRPFFVYFTSVIDTKATATTLAVVEESILRSHLRRADLL